MTKSTIQKILITTFIIVVALILGQSVYYAKNFFDKKTNHEKVLEVLSENNRLSGVSLEDEVENIDAMISKGVYNETDLGLLYEQAGLIYNQLGEEMTYYRYLGYALYYLEQSDEKDYTVNIYLDLACLHINNHAYPSAEEMLSRARDIEPFEEISSVSIKSYAYRVLALLDTDKKNYTQAIEYLNKSQGYIDTIADSDPNAADYTRNNKITLAYIYLRQGLLDDCAAILDQFSESDVVEAKKEPIHLRNFVIPYYQTKSLLALAKNPTASSQELRSLIDDFVKLCQNSDYEKIALDTLLTMQEYCQDNNDTMQKFLAIHIHDLSKKIIEQQSQTYSSILNSQVNDSRLSIAKATEIAENTKSRTALTVLSIIITCLIILFFIIIILNSRRDGLTFLYNRRSFNYDIERIKRSMLPYSVIMLDIDNFKTINDTYGHPEGDKVLQKLGQFINSEVRANSDVRGYRYGGEEFAIIISKNSYPHTMEIAETLRRSMAATTWPFDPDLVITISLGVASGSFSDDVVKKADDNLYFSKQHGKNQIYTD
ncbi:MAG: GGDEF domain-containing protein [Pseudobutyrivibrio sp.]|nr:GGDEF domain-containing protein [Pseudobutyrivibrio sp.]